MLPVIDEIHCYKLAYHQRLLSGESAIPIQRPLDSARNLQSKVAVETLASERWNAAAWFSVLLLSTLGVILYVPVLRLLWQQWLDDPNYGHGIFVPVFAAYLLWRNRARWMAQPLRPNNFGLAIMFIALALLVIGTLGAELFTTRLSLLVMICGIVIFLAGYCALRSIAFPVGYLIFMIPLPAIIYYQITFPLQLLASRLGASGLVALGIHTVREGNLLILPNCTLNVVEACSGIRSLLSLLAAVVAYGYLAESNPAGRHRGVELLLYSSSR